MSLLFHCTDIQEGVGGSKLIVGKGHYEEFPSCSPVEFFFFYTLFSNLSGEEKQLQVPNTSRGGVAGVQLNSLSTTLSLAAQMRWRGRAAGHGSGLHWDDV